MDLWFDKSARESIRDFRDRTRQTPFRIVHRVVPSSGAAATSSYKPDEAADTHEYLRSGALGEMPGQSRDYGVPGGYSTSGRIRASFAGLDTGDDGYETLKLVTGADSMYSSHKGVSVEFEVHGVRYIMDGLTRVDATDEIVVDAFAKEKL